MKGFYRFMKFIFYVPARILFPAKVLNKELLLKEGPTITVSNHLSWIDAILIPLYAPGFRRLMAKKQVAKNKIARWWELNMGVILIDREKSDMTAMRTTIKTLKENGMVHIFPEGTRNKTGTTELQEIKGGSAMFAIKSGAYIQPIMIYRKAKPFRKNYLYVAEPFRLTQFEGELLDSGRLAEADAIIAEKMQAAKSALDAYVAAKKNKKAGKGAEGQA